MWYGIVLFVHISGAIGLFIANSLVALATLRLRQGQTIGQIREWIQLAANAERGIIWISLVIVLSAYYLVVQGWSFTTPWVLTALMAFLVLGFSKNALNGRRLKDIQRAVAIAPDGPLPSQLRDQVRHPRLWLSVSVSMFVRTGLVYLMAVKPGLAGSLIVLGVALTLGVAFALVFGGDGFASQTGRLPKMGVPQKE